MRKPPGVFVLLVAAVTGFGGHIVGLLAAGRDRLLSRPRPSRGSVKR